MVMEGLFKHAMKKLEGKHYTVVLMESRQQFSELLYETALSW